MRLSLLSRSINIQNTVGAIFIILFIIAAITFISWGLTCLFVYWISLLWTNTVFAFEWSYHFATGVWLILILLGSFCSARINFND